MSVDYCLISAKHERLEFDGFILTRGAPFLPCKLSLPKKLKGKLLVDVDSICEVDLSDFDKKVGLGDILTVVGDKELKQLYRGKVLPSQDEYSYLFSKKKKSSLEEADECDETKDEEGEDVECDDEGTKHRAKGKREAANARKAVGAKVGKSAKKGSDLSPSSQPSTSPSLGFQLQKLEEQMGDCQLNDL